MATLCAKLENNGIDFVGFIIAWVAFDVCLARLHCLARDNVKRGLSIGVEGGATR